MLRQVCSIAAGVLSLMALSRPVLARGGDEVEAFKELMAQADQQYSHVEFRSKWINYRPSGEVFQRDQLDGFMAGPYSVSEQTGEYPPPRHATPRGHVSGSNSRYWFSLTHQADAYVLTEVGTPFSAYLARQCMFAVPMTRDTYHSVLDRADTRVVSRSEVAWRGRPHTEWVLDTTFGDSQRPDEPRERIGLFVRADQPGLVRGVRRYDPENPAQWLTETVVEYEPDGGPWPAPKAIEEWEADKTEWLKDKTATYKTWRSSRAEFSLWRQLPLGPPGKEFTLSHYNLPEPKEVPKTIDRGPGLPVGTPPPEFLATAPRRNSGSETSAAPSKPEGPAAVEVGLAAGLIIVLSALAYVVIRPPKAVATRAGESGRSAAA